MTTNEAQSKTEQKDLTELKKKLDNLNESKEFWYKKKADIGQQIREKIDSVKSLKKQRNELTNNVKDLKKKRDSLNKQISEKIKDIIGNKKIFKSSGNINLGKAKKEYEDLEFKIQTVPMNFDTEQKLMKRIKVLKKQIDQANELNVSKEEFKKITEETDGLKKEANEIHKKLKEDADESQKLHEEFISRSKEIDKLKLEEDEAYKKFTELKKEFVELNSQVKDKVSVVKQAKRETKSKKHAENKKKEEKLMAEKTKDVEEKISKKKKLTTEDLLILQRKKD